MPNDAKAFRRRTSKGKLCTIDSFPDGKELMVLSPLLRNKVIRLFKDDEIANVSEKAFFREKPLYQGLHRPGRVLFNVQTIYGFPRGEPLHRSTPHAVERSDSVRNNGQRVEFENLRYVVPIVRDLI